MIARLTAFALVIIALVGGAGYLLGTLLQEPEALLVAFESPTSATQSAPIPAAPLDGSEFVDSDITLQWHWAAGLAKNQVYVLRIWAEDRPRHEIWTAASTLFVGQTIDSFSIDYGVFYWQVAVINLDSEGRYASDGSRWSVISTMQRLRRARIPVTGYAEMSPAARQFADLGLRGNELIDAVHRFIHENSKTNEQLSYSPDYSDAVDLMYRHAQGESAEMPRMLCDGRSTAMLTILKELGIESRLVFLYKDVPGWISQHTVLEVFNPETQYWQTHDLFEDFYYFAPELGIRPNAESLLFDSHTEFVGCPVDGGACSPERAAPWLAFFEALRYGFTFDVWVNPDRINLSARFVGQDNQNLAEFIGKGDPRRVAFRMDSW